MKKTMRRNQKFIAGIVLVGGIIILALCAPLLAPHDPAHISVSDALRAPSSTHLFGTDSLGRDLFSRIVYGARVSVLIGFVAVGISALIGICVGSVAGSYGGWVDEVIMRFVDIMLCFPTFFLILTVIALMEPSMINIMIIIGITSWMGIARLIRGEILSLKEREFILAARSLGFSRKRIILFHLIPNALGPVIVNITLSVASAIFVESSLSFLGIGVQPPTPSWGNILMEAKSTLGTAWWITAFPGMFIFLTIFGFNLIAEGAKDIVEHAGLTRS